MSSRPLRSDVSELSLLEVEVAQLRDATQRPVELDGSDAAIETELESLKQRGRELETRRAELEGRRAQSRAALDVWARQRRAPPLAVAGGLAVGTVLGVAVALGWAQLAAAVLPFGVEVGVGLVVTSYLGAHLGVRAWRRALRG